MNLANRNFIDDFIYSYIYYTYELLYSRFSLFRVHFSLLAKKEHCVWVFHRFMCAYGQSLDDHHDKTKLICNI